MTQAKYSDGDHMTFNVRDRGGESRRSFSDGTTFKHSMGDTMPNNFQDEKTNIPFLDNMLAATSVELSTEAGMSFHPASLGVHGKTMASEGGTAARIFSSARSALGAAYTERTNMARAVQAMTTMGPKRLDEKGRVTNIGIPPEHRAPLQAAMDTAFNRAANRIAVHQQTIFDGLASLKKQIDQSLVPKSHDARAATAASDIRSYIRGLKPEERISFIARACTDQDHEVAAAVLHTTPFISGLNREQAALVRDHAEKCFAPQVRAQYDAANACLLAVDSAGTELIRTYKSLMPAPARPDQSSAALERLKTGS
jgi:hypothetical protein